jgi:hypothetical protein
MNRWAAVSVALVAVALAIWLVVAPSLTSVLVMAFFCVVIVISLVAWLVVRHFGSKKPKRAKAYRRIGAVVVVAVSVVLVLSVLSLLVPLTSHKDESALGAKELWVGIDSASIANFSLKAPYENITLSRLGVCDSGTLTMRKGGSAIISEDVHFDGVTLKTTYLNATAELFGLDIPLSLYGSSVVPEFITSMLTEASLSDVTLHTTDFSASRASFASMVIDSPETVLFIKAERAIVPEMPSLGSLIGGLRGGEVAIDELELENGSFVLENNVSVSFDRAVIEDTRIPVTRKLISTALSTFPRERIPSTIRDAVPALLRGDAIELSDLELGFVGTLDAGHSEITNMRAG